jgi:predicted neutral ceramidase superfamily lipid hydrolase
VEAAMEALYEAAEKPQYNFKTGFSRVIPEEWDNSIGMGSSGIASLTLILQNGLKFTYLVFDGNNMKKGLKEKVHRVGAKIVDDLIVMTSDTHVVNALGATSRGYYPIGEKMNEDRILFYVKEIIESSIEKQEKSKLYYSRTEIPDVTVLGKGGLEKLANTAEKGFALFVKTFSLITSIALLSNIAIIFL